MEETINATSGALEVVGVDFLTPLFKLIFGESGFLTQIGFGGILGGLSVLWGVYIALAFAFSLVLIYLFIYATVQKSKLDELQDGLIKAQEEAFARQKSGGLKSSRFVELQAHVDSDNPNDWKLAIIEADIILDDTLKRQGYAGTSLGERLKSISPSALASLDDAWQAHKVRNQIAHTGDGFVLTHKLVRETIMKYERVFTELGLK